jgi:hypothetical protein
MSAILSAEPDDWPDGYCELAPEPGAHCYRKAVRVVSEPYTPGRFKIKCCDECAQSLIDSGYHDRGLVNG